MRAKILKNGWLKITASNQARRWLKDEYAAGGYPSADQEVNDVMEQLGFERLRPEDLAALTDAPIFSNDVGRDDEGDIYRVGLTWWFPGYMIDDPWEELKNKGRVFFEPAPENETQAERDAAIEGAAFEAWNALKKIQWWWKYHRGDLSKFPASKVLMALQRASLEPEEEDMAEEKGDKAA